MFAGEVVAEGLEVAGAFDCEALWLGLVAGRSLSRASFEVASLIMESRFLKVSAGSCSGLVRYILSRSENA